MSIIHINQIQNKIKTLFEEHLDLSDISLTDTEREHKVLTRCLAAYAIYCSVESTEQSAAEAVVDGGDDNGIDAIYYSPLDKVLIMVQSKFSKSGSGEPDSASVAKFATGARDLFNLNFDRFNNKVQKKSSLIGKALDEFDTKYLLIIVDTFTSATISEHAMRHISDLLSEMNNDGDSGTEQLVKFTRFNQNKIYASLAANAGNAPIDIEVGLSQWGQVSEPYKAVYGMVSGAEVSSWWEMYSNRLFEKNIRQVLGQTEVNEEIENTLRTAQDLFWYYNNGITIICDEIKKTAVGGGTREFGTFKLTNAAIVNGAQTVSSIGKYALSQSPKPALEDAKVSLRVIQLSQAPDEFGKEVTRTNNRQNRIENRDFVSQDPEQRRIKLELALDDIEYNIMRSENYLGGLKSFDLSEATASLACASGNVRLAVQAKGGIGKFWENIEKGIYKEIFNPSVSGYYVYNCVQVVRVIEEVLKNEVEQLPKRSGRSYGLLVHGNRLIAMLTISKLQIRNELKELSFSPNRQEIERVTKHVTEAVNDAVEFHFPGNVLATLFKNLGKCSAVSAVVNSRSF